MPVTMLVIKWAFIAISALGLLWLILKIFSGDVRDHWEKSVPLNLKQGFSYSAFHGKFFGLVFALILAIGLIAYAVVRDFK